MKKLLTLTVVVSIGFASCKKADLQPPTQNTVPVSFKKDSSMVDQTIQAPKNNQLLFAGMIGTGSINGFGFTNIAVTLKQGGDAVSPTAYLRRLYFTIEDASSVIFTSEIKDSVLSTTFSFNSFLKNCPQYQNRAVKIYGDVLSSATNNTGAEDNLALSVQITYTGSDGTSTAHFQTQNLLGQKTIFSSAPQAFSLHSVSDPATPVSGVILDGQEKEVLRYGVAITGVSGTVTEHRLLVQGPAGPAVTALKLFDGNTFIAQASVSGGVATITTSDAVSAGTTKTYSVKPIVSVTTGDVSNYDFTVVLDAVKATSTAGEQKTDGTDRAGNSFRVLRTTFSVERIAIGTQVINDSTEADTYQLRITNIGNFPASFTQISYGLVWANNSPGSIDTLQLKPRLLCGNAQPSGLWTDQNGDTTVGGFFKEVNSILTFTFTSEYTLSAGASVVVTLKTFRKGFKTTNDGFKVRPIFDGTRIDPSYKFINQGTVGLSRKLFSSSPQAASANPFKQLFIYSDQSDPAHSPVPGLSSKDWVNGYGFPDLPDQVWVR